MSNEPTASAADDTPSKSRPFLAQVLLYLGIGGTPGALAALGAIGLEKGFDWIIIGLSAAFAIGGFFLVRYALRIGDFDPPGLGTKTGRNQLVLLGSAVIGVVIGIYFNLTGRVDQVVDGTFTLSPAEAIAGLLILIAFLPITFFWHRGADEHEAAATNGAAMVSINIYFYGYLGWMLAHYANLLPPMNDFALFCIVVFSFLGIWAFKRSG